MGGEKAVHRKASARKPSSSSAAIPHGVNGVAGKSKTQRVRQPLPPRKDKLSRKARSALMSRIHGWDTGPELILARFFGRNRVYFARYAKELPGKPDIVFRRCRLAVFVDGEFWHGHDYAKWKDGLSPFWRTKIEKNMARDRAVDRRLKSLHWLPVHVWGRDILRDAEKSGSRILSIRAKRLRQLSGR